jgi:caa(3)-type oxidase subunit IV
MAKNKKAAAHDSAHDDHRPDVKQYMLVFGALLALTCVTVVISKFHLPRPQAIALGLLVALVKGGLVAAVFMHLWGEKKLIHKILYVVFACAAIMVIPLIDGALIIPKITSRMAVADQHPDEGAPAEAKPEEPAPAPVPAAPAPAPKPAKKGRKS